MYINNTYLVKSSQEKTLHIKSTVDLADSRHIIYWVIKSTEIFSSQFRFSWSYFPQIQMIFLALVFFLVFVDALLILSIDS